VHASLSLLFESLSRADLPEGEGEEQNVLEEEEEEERSGTGGEEERSERRKKRRIGTKEGTRGECMVCQELSPRNPRQRLLRPWCLLPFPWTHRACRNWPHRLMDTYVCYTTKPCGRVSQNSSFYYLIFAYSGLREGEN